MPEARLVLPRGIAGANAFSLPGSARVDLAESTPDLPVVFVIPTLQHVLQAAWIDAIGSRHWVSFETWLAAALADPAGQVGTSGLPSWRYDAVIRSWTEKVGARRVHVVVGDDAQAATEMLAAISSVPASEDLECWPRALSWPEVRMADQLVAELDDLGLVGRNAAEMVHAALSRLALDGVAVPLGASKLPSTLADQAATAATEMRSVVESLGVGIAGDLSALTRLESDETGAQVGLEQAGRLAAGVLEHVATWGQGDDA